MWMWLVESSSSPSSLSEPERRRHFIAVRHTGLLQHSRSWHKFHRRRSHVSYNHSTIMQVLFPTDQHVCKGLRDFNHIASDLIATCGATVYSIMCFDWLGLIDIFAIVNYKYLSNKITGSEMLQRLEKTSMNTYSGKCSSFFNHPMTQMLLALGCLCPRPRPDQGLSLPPGPRKSLHLPMLAAYGFKMHRFPTLLLCCRAYLLRKGEYLNDDND